MFIFFNCQVKDRKRIVVIDSGVDIEKEMKPFMCLEQYDFTGEGLQDSNDHGTMMVKKIIEKIDPKEYCVTVFKFFGYPIEKTQKNYDKAIEALDKIDAAYVNMSISWKYHTKREFEVLKKKTQEGTKIVVAAGNQGAKLTNKKCLYYPACHVLGLDKRNFVVLGNTYSDTSNFGPIVQRWVSGKIVVGNMIKTGTSQSAAIFTNELVRGLK